MKSMTRKSICILLVILLLFGATSVGVQARWVGASGDVDEDGQITSTDARLILQYYSNKIGANSLNILEADVDGDGSITSTDARLVLQFYAGKIPFFPYPTYDGYPSVPQFAILYDVREGYYANDEEGLYVEYAYTDIEAVDPSREILEEYAQLLQNGYGFELIDTMANEEGGNNYYYESADGTLVVVLCYWTDAWAIGAYVPYQYPFYADFPEVPDFGALCGLPEAYCTPGVKSLLTAYEYEDIEKVDPEGDIILAYVGTLMEYGFRQGNIFEEEGVTTIWFEHAEGEVSTALVFREEHLEVFVCRNV